MLERFGKLARTKVCNMLTLLVNILHQFLEINIDFVVYLFVTMSTQNGLIVMPVKKVFLSNIGKVLKHHKYSFMSDFQIKVVFKYK